MDSPHYYLSMEEDRCTSLKEIRNHIDIIDKQIVELLVKRGMYVRQAAKFKKSFSHIKDTKRIDQILDNVTRYSTDLDFDPFIIKKIYEFVIRVYIQLEEDEYNSDLKKI